MSDSPDIGRRGLLTGSVLTRQGRESIKQRQNLLGLRPPWYFLLEMNSHTGELACGESCNQECVTNCSRSIVRIHPEDHAHAGTPWLDYSVTGCTLCGDCAEACPAIESYDRESAQMGNVQLVRDKCLAWNNVFCMSCIGKCDARALKLDARRKLVLSDSLCTGCGMCIHACPVAALNMQFS